MTRTEPKFVAGQSVQETLGCTESQEGYWFVEVASVPNCHLALKVTKKKPIELRGHTGVP